MQRKEGVHLNHRQLLPKRQLTPYLLCVKGPLQTRALLRIASKEPPEKLGSSLGFPGMSAPMRSHPHHGVGGVHWEEGHEAAPEADQKWVQGMKQG